jgi:hypothetical protein
LDEPEEASAVQLAAITLLIRREDEKYFRNKVIVQGFDGNYSIYSLSGTNATDKQRTPVCL